MADNNDIKLKNTSNGIEIFINSRHENEELYDLYKAFLKTKEELFEGAAFERVNVISSFLSEEQRTEIAKITQEKIECDDVGFLTMEDAPSHSFVRNEDKKLKKRFVKIIEEDVICHKEYEMPTKYVDGTVRSGDTVEYKGNVVIIGDVNAGAMIKAKGSIIVLGILRGMVHAGYDGDETASVYALCMAPLQIRIAQIIAKSPDQKRKLSIHPEIAKISGEIITIDSAINL